MSRWSVALVALLPACASGGSTPAPVRGPDTGDAPPASAAGRAPPVDEGVACHAAFRTTGDARADASRLARECRAAERLGDARGGEQSADEPVARFAFAASAGACYRVFAVGGDGVVELDTMLRGPDGRPLARDESAGRAAVMPHGGAVCVAADGVYTIDVAVARGSGRFSVELWRQ